MAAQTPLLAQADVQFVHADGRPGASWADVQVLVRRNRIEIGDSSGTVHTDDTVVACQKSGRSTWRVRVQSGSFTVTRKGGGCGGCGGGG